jgi:hypothetical protein
LIGGYGRYDARAQSQNSLWATAPEAAKAVLNVRCRYPVAAKTHPHILGPEWREIRLDLDPRPPRHHLLDHRYDADRNRISGRNLVFAQYRAPAAPRSAGRTQGVLHSSEATGFAVAGAPESTAGAAARRRESARRSGVQFLEWSDHATRHDLRTLAQGNSFMAHRTGFTARTLQRDLSKPASPRSACVRAPHSICGLPPTGRRAERATQ